MRKRIVVTSFALVGAIAGIWYLIDHSRTPSLLTFSTQSKVEVTFLGLIVHVFGDALGERDRAVVLQDADHPVFLSVPADIDTTELKRITGKTPSGPSSGQRIVGPISGFTIRIVGWDPVNKKVISTMLGQLDPKKTFKDYVPNLEKVSKNTLNQALLKTSLFDPVPEGTDWSLFFNLDGGDLTATKACKPSKFIKDHAGYGTREFSEGVILTGVVGEQPALQFLKKGGTWETVTLLKVPSIAKFVVDAQPQGGALGTSHFHEFARLGSTPPAEFDEIAFVDCEKSTLDPSCTNNQWP